MYATLKHDYDTLTTGPERGPEFYLARHLRRKGLRQGKGDGRLGRLRETARHKKTSVADVIHDRLDRCYTSEFHHYQWYVLMLCVYCNERLFRRSLTRDHVLAQSRGERVFRGGFFVGAQRLRLVHTVDHAAFQQAALARAARAVLAAVRQPHALRHGGGQDRLVALSRKSATARPHGDGEGHGMNS